MGVSRFNVDRYREYLSLADKYARMCEVETHTYPLEQIKKYLTYIKK